MTTLEIPHQILSAGGDSTVDKMAKVVCLSPEKLLEKSVMSSIMKLSWSVVSIDEPHLALQWGLSKTKFSKPFREAFSKLNSLNSLNTCFEIHKATLENVEGILKMLGRKDSAWFKQLEIPERNNLTYFLFSGDRAPQNILQLPSLKRALEDEIQCGITLIYVQKVQDGANLQIELLDYCEMKNLINVNSDLPVGFLHSKLTEDSKKILLEKAVNLKIKVLIATSAAGAGINIPVVQFIGWGLDREHTGLIQSQGRTARNKIESGNVIWVHQPKLHGRAVSSLSKVRDLLQSECLRKTMNSWFKHKDSTIAVSNLDAEFCCSSCMLECIRKFNCLACSSRLSTVEPQFGFDEHKFVTKLTQFLCSLDINKRSPETTPVFKEKSLGKIDIILY